MEISSDNHIKAICTVTELAKKLSLSRARFYQLQKMGVFPMPVYCIRTKRPFYYCIRTKRPFYPLELQQKCLAIRKTGIGHNGQLAIFYRMRKDKPVKLQDQSNPDYKQLAHTLRQMGLKVTVSAVKNATNTFYPKGMPDGDEGAVIRNLFRHFS